MTNQALDPLPAKPMYRAVKTSRLYEQIVQQVEDSITTGQLKPGDDCRPSAIWPSALASAAPQSAKP